MQQMYSCPNCGTMVQYGEQLCPNCGASFDWGGVQDESQSQYDQQQYDQWGQPYDQQPYDQQQYSQQQQWDQQQQGWNQGYPGQQQPNRRRQVQGTGAGRAAPAKALSNSMLIGIIVGLAVLFVAGGIFLVAGGDLLGGKKVAENNQPVVTKPVITFTVNPTSITAGQSANLSWDVPGATSVKIDPNIGAVAVSGTMTVKPSASTSYTLTASNSAGTVTASAALIVNAGGAPNIMNFSANPASIAAGSQSMLQWNVNGATSVTIDKDIGGVSATGSKAIFPSTTTTYTLTATNSNGTTTGTATVTILSSNAPVISSFTANPSTITSGQTSTLQWSITGATSATLDGTTVNAASGTKSISPTSNTTYTLVATNSAGSTTAKATVTIATSSTVPVIASFTANPMTIIANSGNSATLQWSITGATSVSIDNGIGSVTPLTTGTRDVTPNTSTTYIITATNAKGSVTAAVNVVAAPEGSPAIINFSASPSSVSSGQSVTLTWNVSDADTVSIDRGVGSVTATSGSVTVIPTVNPTTYTLTATNEVFSVYATARVTVASGVQFTATPSTIIAGETVTLSWNILGASNVSIQPLGLTGMQGTGEATDTPTVVGTKTYTLTSGSISASATVTVLAVGSPVITNFTASPAAVAAGGTTTLSWNISNAATVTITPGNPPINSTTNGSVNVVVTSVPTTYMITASNTLGQVTRSVTVSAP